MFATIAERGQLDQPAHRKRIHVRGAELVNGAMPPGEQRSENRDHRMSCEVHRDDVEHQLRAGGVEAVATSREIGERSAGVDALIPSGERICERTLDYRGAHDG